MSVLFVNNEAQLYDVVNITGFVYNVSPIEIFEKNEHQIRLRKASLKDYTDEFSITFLGNLAEKVEEETTFFLSDLRVSKYMDIRLLKTTETATATASQEISFDTENHADSYHAEVTGYILSVDLDTLKQKLMCPKWKFIVDLYQIVICSSYGNVGLLQKEKWRCFFSASWYLVTYFICTTRYSRGNVWRCIR